MVATEASVRLAAENGYNCIAGGTALDIIRGWLDLYVEIRSKREGRDFARGEGWALQRPFYVAKTQEKAKADFEFYIRRQREYQALYRGAKAADYVKQTLGTTTEWDWDVLQKTAMLAGTPEYVGEQLQELADAGIDAVNLWTDCGGLPHELAMESLELFVSEVAPKL
jgi:alkanesulfonate monooxygenase SsuD/methylene tetrahydromethanopterin reductase-like flavin-dependent oxidoreductase (luciferase family)